MNGRNETVSFMILNSGLTRHDLKSLEKFEYTVVA